MLLPCLPGIIAAVLDTRGGLVRPVARKESRIRVRTLWGEMLEGTPLVEGSLFCKKSTTQNVFPADNQWLVKKMYPLKT